MITKLSDLVYSKKKIGPRPDQWGIPIAHDRISPCFMFYIFIHLYIQLISFILFGINLRA